MAKEAAQPQDQSMEEILQSIKRIIAEENVEDTGAPQIEKPEKKQAAPKKATAADVLELTDIADDGKEDPMVDFTPATPPTPVITPVAASSTRTESILEAVDREPAAATHKDVLDDIDSLLSSEAAKASAKAFQAIASAPVPAPTPKPVNPGMPFRSGNTVEDLVMEALRPMLKEWLDTNLPVIVERLVEREIKKISHS